MARLSATLLVLAAFGCHGEGTPKVPLVPGGQGPRLAERALAERPKLVLVPREGNPAGAVAFVVESDAGSLAAAVTSAFVAARLEARGVRGVSSRPHALGFSLSMLVADAKQAARFESALEASLAQAPRAGEPALKAAATAAAALATLPVLGAAQSAVTSCSGELARPAGEPRWGPTATGLATLSGWLRAARSGRASAFGAVGPASVLTGIEASLERGPDWPDGPEPTDTWPAADALGVNFTPGAARHLSVAVRVESAALAVGAAEELAATESMLTARLAALRPPWRLERASASSRARGACIRLDLTPPAGDPGPNPPDVAHALAVASQELDAALATPASTALERAVLAPKDPRDAAAAAAWSALTKRVRPGARRRLAAYVTSPAEQPLDLAGAVARERAFAARPSVELLVRSERGQARILALLGSACGTALESDADAGEAALVVTALASGAPRDGVTFSPYVTTGGLGLLVEAARRPGESSGAQAVRLGRALGARLAALHPSPTEVAAVREALLHTIGAHERPGFFAALGATTRGHSSWLEPRGTPGGLESAPAGGFEAALARFLSHPLRLAVLANDDGAQADTVRKAVEQLLRPVRGTVTRCPNRPPPTPETSELTLLAEPDEQGKTIMSVPFPPARGRLPREARASVLLLNGPRGWLAESLTDLSASASATALGGPEAAALVIEVLATAGSEQAALTRILALLDRLAAGTIPARDAAVARQTLEQQDAEARLDPRVRLVELFQGQTDAGPLDVKRLAAFFASLRRESAVVVTVAPRGAP